MDGLESVVIQRLNALGYSTDTDENCIYQIGYLLSGCRAELLANIHQKEVPEGLFYTLSDMAAGRFLLEKLSTGALKIEGLDFTAPLKSITEGDVKVDFASASDGINSAESRFFGMLDHMTHPPENVLSPYRRLSW